MFQSIYVGEAPVYKERPATNGYFYMTSEVMDVLLILASKYKYIHTYVHIYLFYTYIGTCLGAEKTSISLFDYGQVLIPPVSDLPPEPPTLMALLNSSNFTLFRQYALVGVCVCVEYIVLFYIDVIQSDYIFAFVYTDVQLVRELGHKGLYTVDTNRERHQGAPQ